MTEEEQEQVQNETEQGQEEQQQEEKPAEEQQQEQNENITEETPTEDDKTTTEDDKTTTEDDKTTSEEPVKENTEALKEGEETKTTEEAAPAAAEESDDDEDVEYVCPQEFNDKEEMRKMFVGGLDRETTDEELKELFSKFGEILECIIINKETSKSDRLFGFITFKYCDDLEECLLARPHKYKEKDLDVKRAVPRGQEENNGHFKVKKLHIANIPPDFTEKELKKYLVNRHSKKFGIIEDINLLKSKEDPTKNRGFGFITVSTEDFADRIAIGEAKFTLNGNSMRISKAKPKNDGGRMGFRGRNSYGNQPMWGDDWYGYGYGYSGYPPNYGYGYDYYGGYPSHYGAHRSGSRNNRSHPY